LPKRDSVRSATAPINGSVIASTMRVTNIMVPAAAAEMPNTSV
jgi:hypothetical protein